jgi:hypothetical protein
MVQRSADRPARRVLCDPATRLPLASQKVHDKMTVSSSRIIGCISALPLVATLTATCYAASGSITELPNTLYKLFGQPNPRETMINRIVPNACFHAGGVVVDRSHTPERIYVLDSGNNRILGFNGFKAAPAPADIVIGQPSLDSAGTANGNNTIFALPTAATLAILGFPDVNSTLEAPRAIHMACDAQGSLYVVDLSNNRILKYNDPFGTDQVADEVWGQANFTTRVRPAVISASTLSLDFVGQQVFCAGVDVDAAGNLWVADSGHNRVLRFPPGSHTANLVLGQSSFTTADGKPYVLDPPLNRMTKPLAVRVHPATGEVYVLEGEEVPTGRVLVFKPPFSNGMSSDRAFGAANDWRASNQPPTAAEAPYFTQIGFDADHWWVRSTSGLRWARGFAFDPLDPNKVWIGDGGHRRILQFDAQTGAMTDVIGYRDFTAQGDDTLPPRLPDGTYNALAQVDGSFGMTRETGIFLNDAAVTACREKLGLGETIGREIERAKLPNRGLSVYAAAWRLKVPFTTHVAIGTDILYQHPRCDGAAWGEASYRDFLQFAETVSNMGSGGVLLNFGSAVILPEVFLKALTICRNLGHKVFDFTTANFDMIRQYRPQQNIVSRPTMDSGRGFDFAGHHEIMLPLLYTALVNGQKRR